MGDGAQRLALWDMSTLTLRRERERRRTTRRMLIRQGGGTGMVVVLPCNISIV
jgi:hypothetical protein